MSESERIHHGLHNHHGGVSASEDRRGGPEIPPHLARRTQLYADGGISNKTPLKAVLRFGGVSELFVVNTYPSYPNRPSPASPRDIRTSSPMLMRTALELLPNLYFLRDMGTVKDVNNDLAVWEDLRARLQRAADDRSSAHALRASSVRKGSGSHSARAGSRSSIR